MNKNKLKKLERFYAEVIPLDKEKAKLIKKVRAYFLKCESYSQAAEKFGVSYDVVYMWCNPERYKKHKVLKWN